MKRILIILSFFVLCIGAFAQDDTRVVDSLEHVLVTQQGIERIKTMIQMVWAFYDVSFDDGIEWGEKAMRLSHESSNLDLEAQAAYAIGIQYGYHNDLDLAQDYLKTAYNLYIQAGNEAKAFDALWYRAYFELLLGNMDSAYVAYQNVMLMAERLHDSLAFAQTSFNMAVIQYQRNDLDGAISAFKTSKEYYQALNDSLTVAKADVNLATSYGECGRINEAKNIFVSVIPKLIAYKDYDYLLLAFKNYGLLFERDLINYDSACYYFEKALEVTTMESLSQLDRQTMNNSKADVLTELGNVAFLQSEFFQAISYYEAALALAESNHYHLGQMQALVGLGQLYAQQGNASQSLYYLDRYTAEVAESGITLMDHAVRKSLILDYARLGRFSEMDKELTMLDEIRASLSRENSDLLEQNRILQDNAEGLLRQYENQFKQIQTLQSQRNQYRLAFFGLSAIALFAVVLMVAYKIVRKKRANKEKG